LVIITTRQKIWYWLLFLMIVLPGGVCQAAPSLLGTWQGTAPGIVGTSCFNKTVTLTIVQQCGNLFRGHATIDQTTLDVVGRLQGSTSISVNGNTADRTRYFTISGNFVPGPPPGIIVNYLSDGDLENEQYDTFPASFISGKTGTITYLQLLLE
jgi:hypothetical protein